MRAVLQRVKQARVEVDQAVVGAIERGILVFVGIARSDTAADAEYLVDKLSALRIFHDENGKLNRNVREIGGSVLLVSQFTLYGDCSRGRRPSFDDAAPAAQARELYEYVVQLTRQTGIPVQTGLFQATMAVHLENDGPVTLIIDSAKFQRTIGGPIS